MPLFDHDGCPVCPDCAAQLRVLLPTTAHRLTPTERPTPQDDKPPNPPAPIWCSHCRQVIR